MQDVLEIANTWWPQLSPKQNCSPSYFWTSFLRIPATKSRDDEFSWVNASKRFHSCVRRSTLRVEDLKYRARLKVKKKTSNVMSQHEAMRDVTATAEHPHCLALLIALVTLSLFSGSSLHTLIRFYARSLISMLHTHLQAPLACCSHHHKAAVIQVCQTQPSHTCPVVATTVMWPAWFLSHRRAIKRANMVVLP